MFGQLGHFHKFAPENIEYAINRYSKEARRLLGVLEGRLEGRQYIMGDEYTTADIATFPWVRGLSTFYRAEEHLGLKDFPKVNDWLQRCLDRPAAQAGLNVTPFT
eukprot:jgi/Chrzof1/4277/Cz14g06020.t1